MAWTQSDSDVFHTRIMNAATSLVDVLEEVERLQSLAASENLSTNLHDASDASVTKAEAIAVNGVMNSFEDWMAGTATTADAARREKLDAYLVRAKAGSTIP
jgi:hypothetical protein